VTAGGADRAAGLPRTLRATASAVSFWAAAVIAVLLFVDAAVRGSWDVVLRWGPLALFILWVLWLLLLRSSIRLERERVVVVNLARLHEIPWSRVADMLAGPQVRVELDSGRTITCWGGPFPPRPGLRQTAPAPGAVEEMRIVQESAPASDAAVRSRWDVPVLVVGGLLLVVAMLCAALVPQAM
jgi:hypothetical protein